MREQQQVDCQRAAPDGQEVLRFQAPDPDSPGLVDRYAFFGDGFLIWV